MNDDMTWVREFATSRSDSAFTTLVERHIGLVHSAALRQTGDPQLADEIAQTVFLILARKAASLESKTILSAWLYRTTRYAVADALKAQRRRQAREQAAFMQSSLNQPDDTWKQLEPLLDDAMDELGETDRTALVLRFFERKTAREIAEVLRLEESAAQKRVTRALDKLRDIFMKRGVTLTVSAIVGTITANAVPVAPAGLATTISTMAAKSAMTTVSIGIGSKCITILGKSFFFSWFPPLLLFLGSLPSLFFVSFVGRAECNNFQDTQGFRPQLLRRYIRSFLWGFPLLQAAIAIATCAAVAAWGIETWRIILACFMLAMTLKSVRSLTIWHSRFHVCAFAYCAIITVGTILSALDWLPTGILHLPFLLGAVLLLLAMEKRPMKMDYNLFLRVAKGMLNPSETPCENGVPNRLDRHDLLAFARFLASKHLVSDFGWDKNGLILRLPPVENRFLKNMGSLFLPAGNRRYSHLSLNWDATVNTHCGASDARALTMLQSGRTIDAHELGLLADNSATLAWHAFRAGNITAAERALGEQSESEIFFITPARARATFLWKLFIVVPVAILAVLTVLTITQPVWLTGLKQSMSPKRKCAHF